MFVIDDAAAAARLRAARASAVRTPLFAARAGMLWAASAAAADAAASRAAAAAPPRAELDVAAALRLLVSTPPVPAAAAANASPASQFPQQPQQELMSSPILAPLQPHTAPPAPQPNPPQLLPSARPPTPSPSVSGALSEMLRSPSTGSLAAAAAGASGRSSPAGGPLSKSVSRTSFGGGTAAAASAAEAASIAGELTSILVYVLPWKSSSHTRSGRVLPPSVTLRLHTASPVRLVILEALRRASWEASTRTAPGAPISAPPLVGGGMGGGSDAPVLVAAVSAPSMTMKTETRGGEAARVATGRMVAEKEVDTVWSPPPLEAFATDISGSVAAVSTSTTISTSLATLIKCYELRLHDGDGVADEDAPPLEPSRSIGQFAMPPSKGGSVEHVFCLVLARGITIANANAAAAAAAASTTGVATGGAPSSASVPSALARKAVGGITSLASPASLGSQPTIRKVVELAPKASAQGPTIDIPLPTASAAAASQPPLHKGPQPLVFDEDTYLKGSPPHDQLSVNVTTGGGDGDHALRVVLQLHAGTSASVVMVPASAIPVPSSSSLLSSHHSNGVMSVLPQPQQQQFLHPSRVRVQDVLEFVATRHRLPLFFEQFVLRASASEGGRLGLSPPYDLPPQALIQPLELESVELCRKTFADVPTHSFNAAAVTRTRGVATRDGGNGDGTIGLLDGRGRGTDGGGEMGLVSGWGRGGGGGMAASSNSSRAFSQQQQQQQQPQTVMMMQQQQQGEGVRMGFSSSSSSMRPSDAASTYGPLLTTTTSSGKLPPSSTHSTSSAKELNTNGVNSGVGGARLVDAGSLAAASAYVEWCVTKTNKWGYAQKRVLGLDLTRVVNRDPGGRATVTAERLISDIVRVTVPPPSTSTTAFTMTFVTAKGGGGGSGGNSSGGGVGNNNTTARPFEAATPAERTALLAKLSAVLAVKGDASIIVYE